MLYIFTVILFSLQQINEHKSGWGFTGNNLIAKHVVDYNMLWKMCNVSKAQIAAQLHTRAIWLLFITPTAPDCQCLHVWRQQHTVSARREICKKIRFFHTLNTTIGLVHMLFFDSSRRCSSPSNKTSDILLTFIRLHGSENGVMVWFVIFKRQPFPAWAKMWKLMCLFCSRTGILLPFQKTSNNVHWSLR